MASAKNIKPSPYSRDTCFSHGGKTGMGLLYHRYWPLFISLLSVALIFWTMGASGETSEQNSPPKEENNPPAARQETSSEQNGKGAAADDQAAQPVKKVDSEDIILNIRNMLNDAQARDPESAESQALSNQLDAAILRLQQNMKQDEGAAIPKPPAAPKAPAPSAPPDRRLRRSPDIQRIRDPQRRPSTPETVITEPAVEQSVPEPAVLSDPNQSVIRRVNRPEPVPSREKPVQPVPSSKTARTPEKTSPAGSTPEETPKDKDESIKIKVLDGYIKIKTTNDVIDINMLLETVGKELELNFIYPDGDIPTGRVKLQQYGQIHRRELLPLLESVLAFSGYSMVREDPYIKILKHPDVIKKTEIFQPKLDVSAEDVPDESVVVRLIELQHTDYNQIRSLLTSFVPDPSVITTIPNTNYIILTDYARRIPRLLDIISLIDQPGPQRRMEIMELQYVPASKVKTNIETLLNTLTSQTARTSTPSPPSPPTRQPAESRTRPRPSTQPTTSTAQRTQAQQDKPTLLVFDEDINRMFVFGSDEQIEQVKHLLGLFDVDQPGPEIKLITIETHYLSPQEVKEQIEPLIKALHDFKTDTPSSGTSTPPQPTRRPSTRSTPGNPPVPERTPTARTARTSQQTYVGAYMQPDERTRRLFLIGSEEQLKEVEDLLSMIDVPTPGPEIRIVPLEIENITPTEAMDQVKELLTALLEQSTPEAPTSRTSTRGSYTRSAPPPPPSESERTPRPPTTSRSQPATISSMVPEGPYMIADERLRRILVVGSDEKIEQVVDLLVLIDVPDPYENKIRLEVRIPRHLLSINAIDQITELIDALNEQEMDDTMFSTTARTATDARRPPTPTQPPVPRTASSSARRSTRSGFVKATDMGPYLTTDLRTNRMFIIGNEEQILQVDEILILLDVDIKLILEVIDIKHILSSDIAQELADLYTVLYEQDGSGSSSSSYGSRSRSMSRSPINRTEGRDETTGTAMRFTRSPARDSRRGGGGAGQFISVQPTGPHMFPDERTNRLLIIGSEKQIKEIKELIPVLDVVNTIDKMRLEIFRPQYVEAAEAKKILDELGLTKVEKDRLRPRERAQLFTESETPAVRTTSGEEYLIPGLEEPEIRVAVQESTNRIFIYAAEYQMKDIKQIMEHIDTDPNEYMGAYQIYKLENQEPAFVASALQDLMKSDKWDENQNKTIPGLEGAPTIVALDDIFAIGIRASTKQHQEIKKIIDELDRRMPEVLVEAILVQVNTDDALKLGVSLKNNYDVGGTRSSMRDISGVSPFGFSIEGPTSTSRVVTGTGATVAFFTDDFIYATLEALQTEGNARVISKPRVLVNSNQEATINSKREKPTTKTTVVGASGTPIIEFAGYVDAGTELKIKPSISEGREGNDFLKLNITLSVNNFEGEGTENIPPPKTTNTVTTDVTVPDGKIIVLGGLTRSVEAVTVNKVPLLGDIPLIGALFRNTASSQEEGVLYVFVKANIVKDKDFGDLGNLTEDNIIKMEEYEVNYEQQSPIPGISVDRSTRRRALEPADYPKE
ncbi:MAG: hypothetical protein JW860_04215 [Sedimentisphaerales bacterium]|nr:hypothetical protein [Sedimentisphaerales bacterium]